MSDAQTLPTAAEILIVEDEGIVAMELKNRLSNMGYAVVGIVATGEAAIERAAALRPALILMDIKLKGKVDGIIAADRIRTQFDIPIIYLTAYADEQTLERAKVTEPYGYVLKPFEERELQIGIEMALYKHGKQRKTTANERWLATTLSTIGDAVIATDASGQINFINHAAEVLTGWSQAEAMGQDVAQVFNVVDESRRPLENPVRKALREGVLDPLGRDTLLLDKRGMARPVDNRAAPIRNQTGQIIEVVLVFRDLIDSARAHPQTATPSGAHHDVA